MSQVNSSETSPFPSPARKTVENPTRTHSSSPSRTPSPQDRTPPVVKDKEAGESVEVWRGKRSGGNRAPKIEPAGTKSWRQNTQPQHHCNQNGSQVIPRAILKRENTPLHQTPLARWRGYPSEVLDTIDMHLNILLQCISPGCTVELSVRIFPPSLRSSLSTGGSMEVLQTSYSILLPPWLSMTMLFNLVFSVVEFLRISLPGLGYLLRCEEEVGRSTLEGTAKDIRDMLHSLAIAQINYHCVRNILEAVMFSNFQIPNGRQRKAIQFHRETSLLSARKMVHDYMCATNSAAQTHESEVKQLMEDYEMGKIPAMDFDIWMACLECHWGGRIQEIPDYVGILRMAGFEPGKGAPIQLRNPAEFPLIYGLVEAWLNPWMDTDKIFELHNQWVQYQRQQFPPMQTCTVEKLSENLPIDIGRNLSLDRNWRNQLHG